VTNSPSVRSRTPPAIKWLLNERAALAGAAQSLKARELLLVRRVQALQRRTEVLQVEVAESGRLHAQKVASIEALDTSLELIHSGVDPAAAGCVKAWQGKYGERGALKAFLLLKLMQAEPGPLRMTDIANMAIHQFNLTVVRKDERDRLTNTLRKQCSRLQDAGLIEGLHDPSKTSTGIWRWRSPPSLADLAALQVRAQVAADDRNPYGDPT
jgi:hypothetical protein